MKNILLVAVVLFFAETLSFADPFVPTLMTFDASDWIVYPFDGSNVEIPVTLGGKPAAIWLVITTKGKGEEIGEVTNGFLGWHYVNKIDTTLYLSPKVNINIGTTNLIWDGKDNDGGTVKKGEYTYYLWGFDDTSNRYKASDYVMICQDWQPVMSKLFSFDGDKMPMANPMFFGNPPWYDQRTYGGWIHKWKLGHDPEDETGRISTVCEIYSVGSEAENPGFLSCGFPSVNPDDPDIFYQPCRRNDEAIITMLKWTFVADGDAILHNDWGGWESELVFESPAMQNNLNEWARDSGIMTDTQYLYMTGQGGGQLNWNYIYIVGFDGELIAEVNHEEMYMLNDPGNPDENTGMTAVNSDPYLMDWLQTKNNQWIVWGASCLQECVDYTAVIEEGEDFQIIWQNKNGDFFFDHGYLPDAEYPWFCIGGLPEAGEMQGRHSSITVDSKGFNIWGTGQLGLANFGVSTPDGSAIGYFNFADEAVGNQTARKGAGVICDNGGEFDGMYWPGPLHESAWGWGSAEWIGMDNFQGTISNEIIVVETEEAQSEFSIAQNVPNPFNPTTTINFTISEDDFVSLGIYNVAGQKVDTLVNEFRSADSYSVVWDASGLSAGIYFYTLKTNDHAKTMKMTLLK